MKKTYVLILSIFLIVSLILSCRYKITKNTSTLQSKTYLTRDEFIELFPCKERIDTFSYVTFSNFSCNTDKIKHVVNDSIHFFLPEKRQSNIHSRYLYSVQISNDSAFSYTLFEVIEERWMGIVLYNYIGDSLKSFDIIYEEDNNGYTCEDCSTESYWYDTNKYKKSSKWRYKADYSEKVYDYVQVSNNIVLDNGLIDKSFITNDSMVVSSW